MTRVRGRQPSQTASGPIRRGEIWLVDLEPVRGSEADKTRPVVVVSNDASNAAVEITGRGVVTVVPVTSNVGRVFSFQVLLEPADSGLTAASKAQPEQIRAVAVSRFVHRVGRLAPRAMWELDEAVALHLGLS